MHADLVSLGWTEEQWNRISTTVVEEAQRARVAAQALPAVGPVDPSAVAIPAYGLRVETEEKAPPPPPRLVVDSEPTLQLSTIAVNVFVRTAEAADPELRAALVMFRRAANIIACVEDALIFNGRPGPDRRPLVGLAGVPDVYTVHGYGSAVGVMPAAPKKPKEPAAPQSGTDLVDAVVHAIGELEDGGQVGPFACVLGRDLFALSVQPTPSLVLPRDRILPFLQGPLLRSSALDAKQGVVVALGGEPVEIVVASDLSVRYLQTSLEPRFVFRVSERVAVRIKDPLAVVALGA